MPYPQTIQDQAQFDSLCAELDDYEPLPEAVPGPADTTAPLTAEQRTESIDAEILAALVSP